MFPELRDGSRDVSARMVPRPNRYPAKPFGKRISGNIAPTWVVFAMPGHMCRASYWVTTKRAGSRLTLFACSPEVHGAARRGQTSRAKVRP